jgi:sec-independent protein translocase protein TatA
MDFFGMGVGEIALILIVALIIFGPGKLPEIARTLGKLSRNMKKVSTEFTRAVNREINVLDEEKAKTSITPTPQNAVLPPATTPSATPNPAPQTDPDVKPAVTTSEKHD